MTRGLEILAMLAVLLCSSAAIGQAIDAGHFRTLREKASNSELTADERKELDAAARSAGRPAAETDTPSSRDELRQKRLAEYAERQKFVFERSRQQAQVALAAAEKRLPPAEMSREYFVNNELGDDDANGLSPRKNANCGPVRTLSKAVSMLKPGDTLHLAVTNQPYRESLRLGDDFGGVADRPIVIEGHFATLTGSDPLRLDGWVEAGEPGLYKSAKFLTELEEFTDESKLMRVFFIFDGVMQHMGRSSKGNHSRLKAPAVLQPGEWTYVEAEKTFYLKVSGKLADAKIEAPYRRNGVSIRSPKVALTHVIIKDLIVCHALNDGWNLHGTTRSLLLKNIAAYECGDDGISPHETCEVTIDGYWGVGNSTGMANGNLSVTKASNVRLEGNKAHQFMTGHAPTTELRNAIIIAHSGTQPVNVTNAQGTRSRLENVRIIAPPGQKILNVVNSTIEARRITVIGPSWENAGSISVSDSVISGGSVIQLMGGVWKGDNNVYAITLEADKKPPDEREFSGLF